VNEDPQRTSNQPSLSTLILYESSIRHLSLNCRLMFDRFSRLIVFRIIISDTRNSEYAYRMRIMKTWHEAGSINKIPRIRGFRYNSFQGILAIAPTTDRLHIWHPDSLRCISAGMKLESHVAFNHHLTQISRLVADCNAPRQLISRIDSWCLMRFNRVNP